MKEIVRTNYICEFCGKYYVRKHHAEWHEKHCRLNPDNDHKCYHECRHLHKERECDGSTTITCRKKNLTMYGYAAERRRLLDVIGDADMRMPLQCDDYENDAETDFERFFYGKEPVK
jgi:hypothetical protein